MVGKSVAENGSADTPTLETLPLEQVARERANHNSYMYHLTQISLANLFSEVGIEPPVLLLVAVPCFNHVEGHADQHS